MCKPCDSKAELPEFETLQLFGCFALADAEVTCTTTTALGRLAAVLSLDPVALKAEFEDVRPLARRHFQNGAETHVAWQHAVADLNNARCKATHPTGALIQALVRFAASCASTSSVERLFSKAYCSTSVDRGDVGEARIDDEVHLLSHSAGPDDLALCKVFWAPLDATPRGGGGGRGAHATGYNPPKSGGDVAF